MKNKIKVCSHPLARQQKQLLKHINSQSAIGSVLVVHCDRIIVQLKNKSQFTLNPKLDVSLIVSFYSQQTCYP